MNRFSEQLLEAFEVAMDEKVSNLQFDKTIQATIQSVEDLDTGEYRVKYNDGIISAFAADPKETFKQGDAVYVTVPEGDFSNKKFISHRITNNSLSTGQYTELANTIFEISPNFSDLGYTYTSSDSYSLIVGNESYIDVLKSAPASANSRFKAYADQYEYIQISASFLTQFTVDHEVGDYGIQLVLTNLEDQQISYFLNLNDFNGDPYHLSTWSPQSIVVKIPKGQIKSVNAIRFYETGFENEGNVANLFMSDFSLNFVDKIDLTEIPYYLNILPLDGVAFTTSQSQLNLKGCPYGSGELLPVTSCLFQWFERDLSITPGNEAYDKRAGWGWRSIEGANEQILTVNSSQVPWQKTYKLIVVYKSSTLMTKEITLINITFSGEAEIEQVTTGTAVSLKLTNNNYVGNWYYLATSGNQVSIATQVNSVDVTDYLLYSPMTFYCSVYFEDSYLGELTYIMQNIESKEDVSVIFSGESLFSYDANGDINIYDAELERFLQAEIVWKKGIISSACTVKWLDFEGNEIGNEWVDYKNKDSMLNKVRVDRTENILYYTVKHKFKQTPSKNNSFRIEISTLDGQIYSFDKEIVFTKTGDPGTNGTRYQSLITITSNNKFVGTSSSNTSITLNCKVYKDQSEFSEASINWTPVNLTIVSQSGANITVKASNSNKKRYVKATITIIDEGKTTTLYDFFPVDSCTSQLAIDISELPKYIQYAANGRNPQFRKQVPVIKYNGVITTIASGDTDVIKIIEGQFKPIDEFNPDNPIGLITVETSEGIIIYHPIPTYINTFGNEAINGWDGISVEVDNAGGKILAPQVGAGTKDQSTNKFTGVVMGKDSAEKKIGLYGYQAGINSFGLTEDGIAYFGTVGKGRITIDGTSATILGGGGGTSSSGMTITLSAAASSADAIRVGNGNFIVTYGGKLTAKSAIIDGTITAGAGSVIGGWTLAAKRLYSGDGTTYVAFDSGTNNISQAIWAGKADPASAPFRVTRAGALTATSANITGTIKATSGYIGGSNSGWVIGSNKISASGTNKYISLQSDTDYAIIAGNSDSTKAPFWVKHNGDLFASNANIQGKVIIGTVSGSKIGKLDVTENGLTDSTSGVSFTNTGITSKTIKLNNGVLSVSDNQGNVNIKFDLNGLTSNGMSLSKGVLSNGKITQGQSFSILGGLLKSNNLTLENGQLVTTEGNNKITLQNGELFTAPDGTTVQVKITGTGLRAKQYANSGNSYIQLDDDKGIIIYNVNTTTNAQEKVFWAETNGDLHLTGYITALGATLGNWKINENQNYRLESVISAGFYQEGISGQIASKDRKIYLDGNPLSSDNKVLFIQNTTTTTNEDMTKTTSKGTFFVTKDGHMQADGATIKGEITSTSGAIGNWTIDTYKIYNGNVTLYSGAESGYNYASGDPYRIWAGSLNNKPGEAAFFVTNKGVMKANSAIIKGNVNATSGYIGGDSGWNIDSNKLYGSKTVNSKTVYVGFSTQGDYAIYAGSSDTNDNGSSSNPSKAPFWVKFDGSFKATSGQIGNWKINGNNNGILGSVIRDGQGNNRQIYLNGNPASNENVIEVKATNSSSSSISNFYVTQQGKLFAENAEIAGKITATSGDIGGWTVTSKGLYKTDKIYLYSDGSMQLKNNFQVDTQGNVTIKGNITAKSGFIGWENDTDKKGWQIGNSKIFSDNTSISSSHYVALSSSGTYALWAGNSTEANAPFKVTHTGVLTATGATITGNITATTGKIAGWIISDNKLKVRTSSNDTTGSTNLYLNGGPWGAGETKYVIYMSATNPSDTDKSTTLGRFYVTADGHMYAQSAEIRGTIKSKAGEIGSWYITSRALSTIQDENSAQQTTTGMARSGITGYIGNTSIGSIAIWSNMSYNQTDNNFVLQGNDSGTFFAVTHSGKLYCRSADIKGTITASSGYIGNWKIYNNRLQNEDGTVYLSPAGFKLGSNFSVSSSGKLTATGATISGQITMGAGSSINWNNVSESGTVPYDEAGAASSALRSAKSYTDNEINNLNIPVLPDYIESTRIYRARIESPTIVGGEVYAGTFYALNSSNSGYLTITNSGITFTLPGSIQGWNISHSGYNTVIDTSGAYLKLSAENGIWLDASASNIFIGTTSTSLAQYISDHAGTAVFG